MMKVIEDPEAVAKLRSGGDREKNLELLQSEYQVGRSSSAGETKYRSKLIAEDLARPDQRAVPLWSIPVHDRCLRRCGQFPLPLPHLLAHLRPEPFSALG